MGALEMKIDFDPKTKTLYIFGSSVTVHCNHYITNLLKMIDSSPYVDGGMIMYEASERVAKKHLIRIFEKNSISSMQDRISAAEQLFSKLGFGVLNFKLVNGEAVEVVSPYGFIPESWKMQNGRRKDPVCYFTSGYIAGALEAIYDVPPGLYEVYETGCMACGGDICKFIIKPPV
jgi:predicted hydrocarbon binding protein